MILRRRAAVLCLVVSLLLQVAGSLFQPASAQSDSSEPDTTSGSGVASVLQVTGLLDPIVADFVMSGIRKAEDQNLRVVTLQVNSRGSVLSDDALNDFAAAIADADVPITMWIGPSGARAYGEWVDLASLVDRVGVPLGSRLGNAADTSSLDSRFGTPWGSERSRLVNDTVGSEQALEFGYASYPAPTLGDFLVGLGDLGVDSQAVDSSTQLQTQVRLEAPSLVRQQLHTAASPPVAYLLFVIGLALLVFEFYTAGVGVAGVVGAVMFLLGTFGFAILPVRWWALALIVVSLLAFSVDVQTGVPRFWTGFGALALLIGTLFLYEDPASMSWIPMLVGVVGISSMMLSGMPTMVRTRFSTPTIGREWMVGESGTAVEPVDPDGVVEIRGALWRARTNRATPVARGELVKVASVEGLWLEVEPVDGAARDYRERRSSSVDD